MSIDEAVACPVGFGHTCSAKVCSSAPKLGITRGMPSGPSGRILKVACAQQWAQQREQAVEGGS